MRWRSKRGNHTGKTPAAPSLGGTHHPIVCVHHHHTPTLTTPAINHLFTMGITHITTNAQLDGILGQSPTKVSVSLPKSALSVRLTNTPLGY